MTWVVYWHVVCFEVVIYWGANIEVLDAIVNIRINP